VARYLGHLEHTERSPANVRRYRGLLSGWIGPAVGTANPSDVTPGDVDQLLAQMHAAGRSASSTHQARTLLRSAYRWARMTYSIRHNPRPSRQAVTTLARRWPKLVDASAVAARVCVGPVP
jgi:site-specific recombinase XerC